MSEGVEFRKFRFSDYHRAIGMWKETPGIGISAADGPGPMKAFLRRNPGLSFVALEGGLIVGTVLAGHDGRRGYLYHLAVLPRWRGRQVGRRLVECALAALSAAGLDKCHLFVMADNTSAHDFYAATGWQKRDDILVFSASLSPGNPGGGTRSTGQC